MLLDEHILRLARDVGHAEVVPSQAADLSVPARQAKAHRGVEGSHRTAAWRVVLDYVAEPARASVVAGMREALQRWLAYRDGVARACGIARGASGPRLAGV